MLFKCSCGVFVGCYQNDMVWFCHNKQPICQVHCPKFTRGEKVKEQKCFKCRVKDEALVAVALTSDRLT
jgi:hypothetical protein